MDNFSIAQLAQFSGIKAHTIRMWEQRYQALQPQRSKGNTRYYDGGQLRRLLNIVSLIDIEYKISELCAMSDEQLFKLVEKLNHPKSEIIEDFLITQMISTGLSFDESGFEKSFSHCLLRFGIKGTYIKVIAPLLIRIGMMWSSDNIPPSQEHFISNLIRQKLCTAIDSIPFAKAEGEKWLLFLPENEYHEIGLLFAHFLIKSSGKKVIYLGANMPLNGIKEALKETLPDYLLFFRVQKHFQTEINNILSDLSKEFKGKEILLVADSESTAKITAIPKVKFLHSVADLEKKINI